LVEELADFVARHRAHGTLTGDASEPGDRGYAIAVACPCGGVLQRWVTPNDAACELMWSPLIATRN